MTTKSGFDYRVPIIFALSIIFIVSLLALHTDNPEMGNGNDTGYVEECKPYFLNGVQCPLDSNQSNTNLSNSTKAVSNDRQR